MTVRELIERLQQMDQDMLVLKYYPSIERWMSLDGWQPQMVTVTPVDSPLYSGEYVFPHHGDEGCVDAVEI